MQRREAFRTVHADAENALTGLVIPWALNISPLVAAPSSRQWLGTAYPEGMMFYIALDQTTDGRC